MLISSTQDATPPAPVSQDNQPQPLAQDTPPAPFPQDPQPQPSKNNKGNHSLNLESLKKKPSPFDLFALMANPQPPSFDFFTLPESPLLEPPPSINLTCLTTTHELACVISKEVEKPGISTTIVTVSTTDPFSSLNKVEVAIKYYDTHPCSFLVELKSAPEATDLLATSMPALQLSLNEVLPHFQIHILPPCLLILKQKTPPSQLRKKSRKDKLPPPSSANCSPYL